MTIYSLICCLFYDPKDGRYRVDHLRERNYAPSKDLSTFFGDDVCPRPVISTDNRLYQKWGEVVQDLVLSDGELRGEEESGNNTIVYRKWKNGVFSEIKTELLNVLKVIAKITGMPKERMLELNRINSEVQSQDPKADCKEFLRRVEAFTTQVIQDITIMPVNITFLWTKLDDTNNFRGVYCAMELNLTSPALLHTIRFDFKRGHPNNEMISDNLKVKYESKCALTALVSECVGIEECLKRRIEINVSIFLKRNVGEPIPSGICKEIEEASNELEMYSSINRMLLHSSYLIKDFVDKLYFVELFGPYLERMTAKDGTDNEKEVDDNKYPVPNPQEDILIQKLSNAGISGGDASKSEQFKAKNPIIQLIINIIGSVDLRDERLRLLSTQIFGYCNGEHAELFPNISDIPFNFLPEFVKFEDIEECYQNNPFFYLFLICVFPNTHFKIWRNIRGFHGDDFFKYICHTNQSIMISYYLPAATSVRVKCPIGMEILKEDLKIRDGLIEPGSGAFSRAAFLFSISVYSKYRKGIEIVCNSWEKIRGEDIYLKFVFRENTPFVFFWLCTAPEDFLEEFYGDLDNEKRLMEIYCHLAVNSIQFNAAYDLFETLYNSLESYIRDQFHFTTEMLDSETHPNNSDAFYLALVYINALQEFITRVDTFGKDAVKSLNEKSKSDSKFNKDFDGMNGWLSKMKKRFENIYTGQLLSSEGYNKLRETTGEIYDSLVAKGAISKMTELMDRVCDKFNKQGDLDNVKELFNAICDKLNSKESLDVAMELLKKTFSQLNFFGRLNKVNDLMEKVLNEIKEAKILSIEDLVSLR